MQPLMSADQPDQKAMESQIDKVVTARGDMERANSRFLLDVRMKLTPGQWKQLRQSRGTGMGLRDPGANGPMGPARQRRRRQEHATASSGWRRSSGSSGRRTGQAPGTGMEQ